MKRYSRMTAAVDFWLEFGSTYSYPAAMRIGPLAASAGVTVRWRPFALGAIFKAQGWPADSPFNWQEAKGRYMWRDLERLCAAQGLPFRRPEPFPQPSILAARVAVIGLQEGWGEDFSRAVYRAEFGEGKQIGESAVIGDFLAALDIDPEPVLARAQSDEIKSKLRAQTDEAQSLGIFGAPSFVVGGELFWGNDRLEQAIAWARTPGDSSEPAAQPPKR
jgi:2-hydroxychromene-2-carboxylate isomerase